MDVQRDAEVNQLWTDNLMLRAENVQIRQSLTMYLSATGNYQGLAMLMSEGSVSATPFKAVQPPEGESLMSRRAEAKPPDVATSSADTTGPVAPMSEQEARANGNRAAVRRYRERKKILDAALDTTKSQLKTENVMLRTENVQLRHSHTMLMSAKGYGVPGHAPSVPTVPGLPPLMPALPFLAESVGAHKASGPLPFPPGALGLGAPTAGPHFAGAPPPGLMLPGLMMPPLGMMIPLGMTSGPEHTPMGNPGTVSPQDRLLAQWLAGQQQMGNLSRPLSASDLKNMGRSNQ